MAMSKRVHVYQSEQIIVRWDAGRCIHAAECVARLPEVFDTSQRRWVQPDHAPASDVAEAVRRCPTGALHFESVEGDASEAIPPTNTITLVQNGPLYVRGNLRIAGPDGAELVRDTRVALCRCGASTNKPFCDNTHLDNDFRADGLLREHDAHPTPDAGVSAPVLSIQIEAAGPYHIQGEMDIYGPAGRLLAHTDDAWFCRCGGSADKPFCDGTHGQNGFED
jgi:CDGSH-type Zn-finger protein/uncharacterized Fe-S cluster protein YjdI